MKIQINATKRLLATEGMEIDGASGEAWWNSLPKEKQAEYLKRHPKSKFGKGAGGAAPADKPVAPAKTPKTKAPPKKQMLAPVPKLSELYEYSDEFTPEQNKQAEQQALKEIQRVKEQNKKISEQNKSGQKERTQFTKETLQKHDPKQIGNTVKGLNSKSLNKVVDEWSGRDKKLAKLPEAERKQKFKEDLMKSPQMRKNFVSWWLTNLSSDRSVPSDKKKEIKQSITQLYKTGKDSAMKDLIDSML
jgi:hypothetical protein